MAAGLEDTSADEDLRIAQHDFSKLQASHLKVPIDVMGRLSISRHS